MSLKILNRRGGCLFENALTGRSHRHILLKYFDGMDWQNSS